MLKESATINYGESIDGLCSPRREFKPYGTQIGKSYKVTKPRNRIKTSMYKCAKRRSNDREKGTDNISRGLILFFSILAFIIFSIYYTYQPYYLFIAVPYIAVCIYAISKILKSSGYEHS